MSKPEAQTWLRKNAWFACQNEYCASEYTYHADMFAVWEGKPICENCFDDIPQIWDENGEAKRWSCLPEFDPFKDAFR